jgi:hypothetical protein
MKKGRGKCLDCPKKGFDFPNGAIGDAPGSEKNDYSSNIIDSIFNKARRR